MDSEVDKISDHMADKNLTDSEEDMKVDSEEDKILDHMAVKSHMDSEAVMVVMADKNLTDSGVDNTILANLKDMKATEAINHLDTGEISEENPTEILDQLDTAETSEVINHSAVRSVDMRNHTVATILVVLLLWAVTVMLVMVILDLFLPK